MVVTNQASAQGLRRANQATAKLLQDLAGMAHPGVTTGELDEYAMDYITRLGAVPVFHTEEGFPGCINTSINDAAVHGVPGKQKLKIGDLLSIDTTREAMMAGIRAAMPGKHIGDIGYAIQTFAEARGFNVVREFIGHGLGQRMHEKPDVPSVGRPGTGPVIPEGLVITIEPILVEKSPRVQVDADGWTVRTVDGGWTAQFEHTVMLTRQGAVILSEA